MSQRTASAALFSQAHRASAAGRVEAALKLGELLVRREPSAENVINFAILQKFCGQPAAALATLRRAEQDHRIHSREMRIYQALFGMSEISPEEAAALHRRCIDERPMDGTMRYRLGSLLSRLRRFDEANAQFARGTLVRCGDGRFTSTRVVRFPPRAGDGTAALPMRRELDLDTGAAPQGDAEHVWFAACDTRYFHKFAASMCNSVVAKSQLRPAIHIHLINPAAGDEAALQRLRAALPVPLAWSHECTDCSELSEFQLRTYYSCARYLLLPDLRRRYTVPIVIADIDQLVVRSLRPLLRDAGASDVGLMLFDDQIANILALISATFMILNATDGARQFADTVHDVLADRMHDAPGFGWHLDQAALAVAYYFHAELRRFLVPPRILDSQIVEGDTVLPPSPEALLWSITATHAANAAKLNSPTFLAALNATLEET